MDCTQQNPSLKIAQADRYPGCLRAMQAMRSAGLATSVAALALLAGCQTLTPNLSEPVEGIVWQLDNASIHARGNWQEIGARKLLVQWVAVDGISYLEGSHQKTAPQIPDWHRIAGEPWAQEVILGLAGRFDETAARADVADLVAQSERLAKLPIALNVVGWYFPVEVDSTWSDAQTIGPLLAKLPRPLWISVYDRANIGAEPLAAWLDNWLPKDVGVMFQDGVGVHARTAAVAREYAVVLSQRLGQARVKIIAEGFRPKSEGAFRSATVDEISEQLRTYRGLPVYLFDGPHYISHDLVKRIKETLAKSK